MPKNAVCGWIDEGLEINMAEEWRNIKLKVFWEMPASYLWGFVPTLYENIYYWTLIT